MNYPTNFICAGTEYATLEKHVPAPYFRKTFFVKDKVQTAELIITGLGYYEVYLNGEDITKGLLAPYRSNPDDILYYDKYDVASKLKKGKNVIGIILGNGILNAMGAYVWDFDKAKFRSAPKTAFSLEIGYENAENDTVISDTDTLTAPSPILFDDLHFGEYYDARLEIPGWNLPDFDDSKWAKSTLAEMPRGTAKICEAEPIVIRGELKPVAITKQEDSFVYDFGVNAAGLCKLKINGKPGQKILLQHGETIKDGKVILTNIRFHDNDRYQEDEYYCKGGNTEEHMPRFTYHGFRYAVVTGITEDQATEDLLTYQIISSDIKENARFSCDNEIVNKIQEATVRSDISNFHYFPTDCPQREKNGWTADAALSSEQVLINLTPENSYKEWMRNIYKALTDEGKLPGIVPTTGWGYHWGNGPAWDNVIVYLPYFTYIYRGDRQIIEESAAPLMRYLNYLYSRLDENSLMCIGLGDWCPPGKKEDDFKAPLIVTDSILTVDIAEKCAFIYGELGQEPQKQFAETLAATVKDAIRKHLINKETLVVNGECQTTQAMAIYYGIFEEDEKPAALKVLLKYIDEADGHMNTGVLGGRVIYRVLAENGEEELAYNMIVRPDYPSYGNWIKRGATSLFESFQPEGGRLLSLNHHFWGDVSAWFYKFLAGINVNPTGKDALNIDIRPYFISSLSNVKADYNTSAGTLKVEWSKNDDKVSLNLVIPDGVHGSIILPKGYVLSSGEDKSVLATGNLKIVKA